ncbi:hypothetical protein CP8484711_0310A, partial [Chlamydia psittaci 84-8471/1]
MVCCVFTWNVSFPLIAVRCTSV